MNDLISRTEIAKKAFRYEVNGKQSAPVVFLSNIKKSPTIDAEPVRHGHWIEQEKYTFGTMYDCSICDNRILDNGHSWNYCPNCGAKMDEVSE